jgi:hypothetical protein
MRAITACAFGRNNGEADQQHNWDDTIARLVGDGAAEVRITSIDPSWKAATQIDRGRLPMWRPIVVWGPFLLVENRGVFPVRFRLTG